MSALRRRRHSDSVNASELVCLHFNLLLCARALMFFRRSCFDGGSRRGGFASPPVSGAPRTPSALTNMDASAKPLNVDTCPQAGVEHFNSVSKTTTRVEWCETQRTHDAHAVRHLALTVVHEKEPHRGQSTVASLNNEPVEGGEVVPAVEDADLEERRAELGRLCRLHLHAAVRVTHLHRVHALPRHRRRAVALVHAQITDVRRHRLHLRDEHRRRELDDHLLREAPRGRPEGGLILVDHRVRGVRRVEARRRDHLSTTRLRC
mmetsp:Transcript_5739/g.20590  ORF Transcript_5739/g.20590 Transcript_5739/m.20590 type:complete len:263 (+) Transcript_5739:1683-2471(+)